LKKWDNEKWQVDKNGRLTKQQVAEKTIWQNGELNKWQVDKITF
jgi:hypothetical protein